MKKMKTTYWLLIVIGLLSVMASVYFYFQGKPLDNYLFSGLMGLVFAGTGYAGLKNKIKEGAENN